MSRALLFNPIRARDGEIEATLVARAPLLDELERAIVGDSTGASVRHWLVVAPRGSGKTHVTEALARRVRARPGWSVVRLPEEAYRVSTVGDLLARIVGELEGEDRPFAGETDPVRIETLAEGRLRRWRAERGPVLVIVENFQELLGRRFDRRGQARLRALLMGDPPFTLVATATRMFNEVATVGAPFYDFLQERRLEELSADEVAELVRLRAEWDKAEELLAKPDEVRPRVLALYHLSGGNPRLVLALYAVLRAGLTGELYDQLMQLLDDVTPYYQSRLNDASPQGARVLAEMAMAEGPLVPSEIGRRCGFKTSQVTAILAQMQAERFVRPGGRPADKRARYWEVTDRLFRVWLQMREQGDSRGTLRWIVEFYRAWYGGDFVGAAVDASRLIGQAWKEGGGVWEDVARTLRHLDEALGGGTGVVSTIAWASAGPFVDPTQAGVLRSRWDEASPDGRAAIGVPFAICLIRSGKHAEARNVLHELAMAGVPFAAILVIALLVMVGELDEARGVLARHPELRAVYASALASNGRYAELLTIRPSIEDDLSDDVGPDWSFARFVTGESLDDAELEILRSWVADRGDRGVILTSLLAAVTERMKFAKSDHEAANYQALVPDAHVLLHACLRALRFALAENNRRPFGAEAPFPLSPRAVEEAWLEGAPQLDLTKTPGLGTNVLAIYRTLLTLNLLPDLTPWSEALRVQDAPDREAALSALHPEVREAVQLLLDQAAAQSPLPHQQNRPPKHPKHQ